MLNESIQYVDGVLFCDGVEIPDIVVAVGTPTYIYSKTRVLQNYAQLQQAFQRLNAHVHYSAKANSNLVLMRALVDAGAGIDAVSAGEIMRALKAGANPTDIVFAGVGKTPSELRYALEQGVGWFNVENVDECRILNEIAGGMGVTAQVALRFNPDVQANTHPHIATGHKGAKFGLNADDLQWVLAHQVEYANLHVAGIHLHVGSQLGDTTATLTGIKAALAIIEPYDIHTINIGGGFPATYTTRENTESQALPTFADFANQIEPLLRGYQLILEPGRSIVADAGILVAQVLYVKAQGGVTIYVVDASMTELMRPALYGAYHHMVPVVEQSAEMQAVTVVGPVCETTDTLGKEMILPPMQHGDLLAILDTGAYGMVMANNYNQRPRPAEVVVSDGMWELARRRETYEDLMQFEK